MARKILLLLALCMSDSAGTANRRLSFCTVIYGNGAQGVLRAWESWCHKVVSERLGERCPVVCVYANDKTKASAAENTHTHRGTHTENTHTQRHTHTCTQRHAHVHAYSGHAVSIFSSCSSVSPFATPVPSFPQSSPPLLDAAV